MKEKINRKTYNGHKISIAHGYEEIYLPEHPRARAQGNVYVHEIVAEGIVGRHLMASEVVHHKDGDKSNNDIDNLMIFDSPSSHTAYHFLIKKNFNCDYVLYRHNGVYHCETNIDLIQNKAIYKINVHKKDNKYHTASSFRKAKLCPFCGRPMEATATKCLQCKKEQDRSAWPCKQQLKKDLQQIGSFVGVGKKYGVTDNAVRRWCRAYGLPAKSSVLKYLSKDEWKKL